MEQNENVVLDENVPLVVTGGLPLLVNPVQRTAETPQVALRSRIEGGGLERWGGYLRLHN